MLVITRRSGQSLYIYPSQELDQSMTVRELFQNGVIEIVILESTPKRQRMGVHAPKGLTILREEAVKIHTMPPAFA